MILAEAFLQLVLAAVRLTLVACVVVNPNYFLPILRSSIRTQRHGHRLHLPPGPRPWPVIGNLASIGALPHQALAKLSKVYGPLMYLRLGSVPTVVVSSPKLAEEILKTHDRVFASRPQVTSCEIMAYGSQNFGFLPYGDQWRDARKLFTSELLTANRIQDTQGLRKEEILSMLKSVLEESARGKPVRMFTHFFQLATNIVTRLMISRRYFQDVTEDSSEFQEITGEFFRLFGVFNIGDFIPWLKRFDLQGYEKQMRIVHSKVDGILQRLVDSRKKELLQRHINGNEEEALVPEDFMTALLTRPTQSTGNPMKEDQIKAMLVDVLLAGTDTTAVTLEWAMTQLLKNPHILKKCQEELDLIVGRDRLVEERDICHLPYLLAVLKETFRLHPAGALMLPHQSTQACEVGGYFVPAKSRVLINLWAMGRDTSIWGEHALQFNPERFLPNQMASSAAEG